MSQSQKSELVFIGLGLYDENDISLNGLNEIQKCDIVFAEFYTSAMSGTTIEKLENTIHKKITVLGRDAVEDGTKILDAAKNKKVAFLVGGEPMVATTHIDLRLRAMKLGIKTRIIHNASIVTAAAALLGLQQYKFGRITTIPFPQKDYSPTSFYDVIEKNRNDGLHTLVLLDTFQNKYMTANECIKILLEIESLKKRNAVTEDTLVCVVGRAGSPNPTVYADKVKILVDVDFGPPLHCIIIPGKLHFMEEESLNLFRK